MDIPRFWAWYIHWVISLVSIVSLSICSGYSQSWSDPTPIFAKEYITDPDFTISPKNILYCVWSRKTGNNEFKIYCSTSDNEGLTWNNAEEVIGIKGKWIASPKVVVDMLDNVYVSYNYDIASVGHTQVYIRKYASGYWQDPILLSEGYSGAERNILAIDNNNKLYCFWNLGFLKATIYFRYKIVTNPTWSNVIQPFKSEDTYVINDVSIDNNNTLHCIGGYSKTENFSDSQRCIYFNISEQQLNAFTVLIDSVSGLGQITHDKFNRPFCCANIISASADTQGTALFYTYNNGVAWVKPEIIHPTSVVRQDLVKDINGKAHIVAYEKYNTSNLLVHYYESSGGWDRTVIEDKGLLYDNIKLISTANNILLLYLRIDSASQISGDPYSSIQFRKLEIFNKVESMEINFGLKVFPNPFSDKLNILSLTPNRIKTITIYNIFYEFVGRIRILNDNTIGNLDTFEWNGRDTYGNTVPAGLYLLRVQFENKEYQMPTVYKVLKY